MLVERGIYLLIALISIILILTGFILVIEKYEFKTGYIMITASLIAIVISTYIKTNYPIAAANKFLMEVK